jgi:hypothetical protein
VARFIRDEKRTYSFTWLAAGGVFFMSAVWAGYAELVTRVPWQAHQEAFFQMEHEQAQQALARANEQWEKELAPSLKDKLDRKAAIQESMKTGEYKQATDRAGCARRPVRPGRAGEDLRRQRSRRGLLLPKPR